MDLLAEEALITRRARSGDQAAFADLVNRYTGAVYNQAYRMLGNAQEAEDAVQEVFLRAYRRLDTYDSSRRFVTWLLTIGSNYCIDRLRRRRMNWLTLDDVAFWLTSSEAGPERQALDAEQHDHVQQALQTLPEGYRSVTFLRYWHDLSYLEIAEMLNLTEATVKTRLHRARKMLRDRLCEDGEEQWKTEILT
ncbi:sigma-70 family RNA polymerase sigma factor [Oscillochloris trichoides DG-6]|uniref:Sigma-70 family RNA polymerase sigma factor n=1 Tax=Oscillochloris trichoides DG-6 TaxID=765420 RepID=E1IE08_9CHLR|nr:sigma-70 family RNA polymerase sigma factor [Oscillochloris trichoides]EFO80619.1 sigma-70 family RNA polymerase sigma factor [Oscillochloris trichoides DG-6]